MALVTPTILWATLLIGIPIVIHFFTFRKIKVIYFSTIQFIEKLKNESEQRRTIKHWLILFSRIFLIVALVLTFAQPFIPSQDTRNGQLFIIDNTNSMRAEVAEGQSNLDINREFLFGQVQNASINDLFGITTLNNLSNINLRRSREWTETFLSQLTFSNVNLQLKTDELKQLGSSKFFILSDFQKSGFGKLDALDSLNNRIDLVVSERNATHNLFVDTAYLDTHLIGSEEVIIRAIVKNGGTTSSPSTQIKLINEGRLLSTQATKVDALGKSELEFPLKYSDLLSKRISLELNDYPITYDNVFYVNFPEPIRPRVVNLFDQEENTYIKRLFYQNDYFSYTAMSMGSVDYELLSAADFVILDHIQNLPSAVLRSIEKVNVLVIPHAEKTNLDSFGQIQTESISMNDFSDLAISAQDDPFFGQIFSNERVEFGMPQAKPVLNLKSPSKVLLTTKSGVPGLVLVGNPLRQVYALSFPLLPEYTNLMNHALFLPLIYRMIENAVELNQPIFFRTSDELVPIPAEVAPLEQNVRVVGDETEFIPTIQKTNGYLNIGLPPDQANPGFFSVYNGEALIGQFALNGEKDESILEYYTLEELQRYADSRDNISIVQVDTDLLSANTQILETGTFDWTKFALFAAMFFILIESLLVRFL